MKKETIKTIHRSMRTHFLGIRFPLFRGMYVRRMVRELVENRSLLDVLSQCLRRLVSVRRSIRSRLLTEYNKLGQVTLAARLRRCKLARKEPMRLVLRRKTSKKGM